MFIKQLGIAAALAVAGGFATAGSIDFDFNGTTVELVGVTTGTGGDSGQPSVSDLMLTDNANALMAAMLFEGSNQLPGPIVPETFRMTLSLSGLDVTGGTMSFGDGDEIYSATIDAPIGTVSHNSGVETFTIRAATSGDTTGLFNIFNQIVEIDGNGAIVPFELLGSSSRRGAYANVPETLPLAGVATPTPTAAAAGLTALGFLAMRRRRGA